MSDLNTNLNKEEVIQSPFRIYPGDRLVFDGAKTTIPQDYQTARMMKFSEELDYQILETINKLSYCTSKQITEDLICRGIKVHIREKVQDEEDKYQDRVKEVTQDKVRARLNFLVKLNIITRYRFECDTGAPNLRVYLLQNMGVNILKTRDITCDWRAGDALKGIVSIKSILARNNLLNLLRTGLQNIGTWDTDKKIRVVNAGAGSVSNLTPNIIVNIIGDDGSPVPFIFEFIRNGNGYKEKVIERMSSYKHFYSNFQPSPGMMTLPKFVIVGEDDRHVYEIATELRDNDIAKLGENEILYTTDNRIIDGDFMKLFFKVKDDQFIILKNKIFKPIETLEDESGI